MQPTEADDDHCYCSNRAARTNIRITALIRKFWCVISDIDAGHYRDQQFILLCKDTPTAQQHINF